MPHLTSADETSRHRVLVAHLYAALRDPKGVDRVLGALGKA